MISKEVTKTQLSLPKGGGAIRGIGETFQPNEFTGTAGLSLPIPTSPCRGFEPRLTLEYSSGSGNGIFGIGFNLSIPNISRKTAKGIPQYRDDDNNGEPDVFLLSNAEDLVPMEGGPSVRTIEQVTYTVVTYRPRLEGLFAKIERWTNAQTGESHWRVVSQENITSIFGKTGETRIADPDNPHHVFQWLLTETFDAHGNHVVYEYKAEDGEGIPPVFTRTTGFKRPRSTSSGFGTATPHRSRKEQKTRATGCSGSYSIMGSTILTRQTPTPIHRKSRG